jgi:hypothetical protein
MCPLFEKTTKCEAFSRDMMCNCFAPDDLPQGQSMVIQFSGALLGVATSLRTCLASVGPWPADKPGPKEI